MSERSLGSVVVAIKAVDEASGVMDKIRASMGILGSTLGQLGGGFSSLGNVISGFAGAGILGAASAGLGEVIKGLQFSVQQAAESEQAWTDLQAAVRLTGPAWDEARASLDKLASQIQRTTTFSDEAILQGIQRLTTFGMSWQDASKVIGTAVDFAAAKHIDLQTAVDLLGKAATGNATLMQRYGVDIESIKESLGEGATEADVFNAVIEKLNTQFGGVAQEQAKSYAGIQERLKNAVSDLGEKIGGLLLPALAGVTEAMIPVVDWVGKGVDAVGAWISEVQKMPEVQAATQAVGDAFSGLWQGLQDVGKAAAETLGPALQELQAAFTDIWEALQPLGEAFGILMEAITGSSGSGNILKDILGLVADGIRIIAKIIKEVAPVIRALAEGFKTAAEIVGPALTWIVDAVSKGIETIRGVIDMFVAWFVGHSVWQDLWNAVIRVLSDAWNNVLSIFQTAITVLSTAASAGWSLIMSIIQTAVQTGLTVIQTAFQTFAATVTGIFETFRGQAIAAVQGIMNKIDESARKWQELVNAINVAIGSILVNVDLFFKNLSEMFEKRLDFVITRVVASLSIMRDHWTATLDAMAAQTVTWAHTIADTIWSMVNDIIAAFQTAQTTITAGSIWPDMWKNMAHQTREGLAEIAGLTEAGLGAFEANVAVTGRRAAETPPIPTMPSMISTELTIPISVQLDGREIMRIVKRGLAETAAFSSRSFSQQTKA